MRHQGLPYAAARSSLSPTAGDDLERVIRQRSLERPRSQGARIQTSRSSSVVRITGMALGWIGSTTAFRCCCQEAVDEMRTGYRLRLGATVAPEFGPDATERRERSVIVEREPDHVFLFGPRVWLRRIFAEAIERHQAPVLGLEPSAPVRRGRIPDVCDRISTGPWWRRHAPAHHNQLDLNGEARTARTNRVARSFRQLRRFHHVIISNKVFGTHEGFRLYRFRIESTVGSRRSSLPHEIGYARRLSYILLLGPKRPALGGRPIRPVQPAALPQVSSSDCWQRARQIRDKNRQAPSDRPSAIPSVQTNPDEQIAGKRN
jgi:hypothetical protein